MFTDRNVVPNEVPNHPVSTLHLLYKKLTLTSLPSDWVCIDIE